MYMKAEDIERRCLPSAELEVRLGENDAPKIVGYAAVFDTWADIGGWFKESIRKGAFAKTIKENDIRALVNHNENYVLGRNKAGTASLREDKRGLSVEITPPITSWANDLMVSMRRGDVSQMSFGFYVNKQEVDYEKDERVLTDVTLFDVSVVTYPAYPTTSAEVRAQFKKSSAVDAATYQINSITIDGTMSMVTVLDFIFAKIRAGEELTEEEAKVLAEHTRILSVPPAQHTETPPEPAANHSDEDTRKKDKWSELYIKAERIAPSIQ